jgi:outer membrane protein OmpA-like peptidoglycan-associated protein
MAHQLKRAKKLKLNKMLLTRKFIALSLIACMGMVIFYSCNWSKTAQGGSAGAAGGAVIGGIIGKNSGNTAKGAILGAVIGGAAGAAIGHYMDKQAEEIEQDLEGAEVERVGEGIKITFDSGLLFKVNESSLTPATKDNLNELSNTLQKYEDTKILIEGHTDATGKDEYNQTLSEKRAQSVSNYLIGLGVDGSRITTKGYGETQPVADNETEAGRQENRRVEMAIFANEKLKKAAERGDMIEPEE